MSQWLYLSRPVRPEIVTDPTRAETDAVERHFRRLQAMLADGRLILAGRAQEGNARDVLRPGFPAAVTRCYSGLRKPCYANPPPGGPDE